MANMTIEALKARLAAQGKKASGDKFDAPSLPVKLGDATLSADPRVFSTGGSGWYGRTKATFHGLGCTVQVTVTVDGSKPQDGRATPKVSVPQNTRKDTTQAASIPAAIGA